MVSSMELKYRCRIPRTFIADSSVFDGWRVRKLLAYAISDRATQETRLAMNLEHVATSLMNSIERPHVLPRF